MKLLQFTGSKINEYLEIKIDFQEDLTILTGINGSGKTTSLNLIQAILLPKIQDLLIIPFEELKLDLENGNNIYRIQINKHKEVIIFMVFLSSSHNSTLNPIFQPLQIPRDIINDYEIYKLKISEGKKFDFLLKKYRDEEFFKFIDKLNKPTLIGLERNSMDVSEDYKDYLYERNLYLRKETLSEKTRSRPDLGISTLETEMLVQNVYKRVKEIRDHYYKLINKELITSSFDFTEFSIENFSNTFDIKEKYKILEKKDEIEETLKSIGFLDTELSNKLRIFFEKIESVFRQFNGKNHNVTLALILNKSQLDKLSNVLNIIDDYNSKANKIFEPVNKFLDLINGFFKDSGKKIQIDSVGRLIVSKPQGRNLTIEELSSGERQLVVLFANVIFGKYTPRRKYASDIFIIDEPEISLHIRWQENFITSLLEASSRLQIIIATHSPDIIGEYKYKAQRINNKNKI